MVLLKRINIKSFMLRKPSVAVVIATVYLLVYYMIFYFGKDLQPVLWMFMGAPFVLGWLAYTIIRYGKYNGRELNENEEWGYSDKERSAL